MIAVGCEGEDNVEKECSSLRYTITPEAGTNSSPEAFTLYTVPPMC
ncbi:MAG: hypothetical protein LBD75_06485 [Candidatus Peribacteria bacterium]|jgi:hypothetical protein|nr:hypothetical protein [Candidatus Peribacteria bacterium]